MVGIDCVLILHEGLYITNNIPLTAESSQLRTGLGIASAKAGEDAKSAPSDTQVEKPRADTSSTAPSPTNDREPRFV